MKFQKIFLITILLVLFLTISSISASDDINEVSDSSVVLMGNGLSNVGSPLRSTQMIYVNDSGNDDNPGTPDLPFKTINKAVLNITTGTANIYLNGTFSGDGNRNINITQGVKLNFIGVGDTKIDGGETKIFNIESSPQVTFSNINFINGLTRDNGGAIYNKGNLSISDCKFINNSAVGFGGAVFNDGNLTISNSKFDNNVAPNGGSAIYNNKTLFLRNNAILGSNIAQIFNNGQIISQTYLTILENSNINCLVGERVSLNATLKDDKNNFIKTKNISFLINKNDDISKKVSTNFENNYFITEFYPTLAGTYNVSGEYNGSSLLNILNGTITVNKADAGLTVSAPNVEYPNNLVVFASVSSNATGTVTFTIGSISKNVTITNGIAFTSFNNLNTGNYNVIVTYNGDDYFSENTVNINANVWKATADLTASVQNVTFPGDLIVTANVKDGATGNVIFTIGSNSQTSIISNNTAKANFTGLNVGIYNVTVKYSGDNNFNSSNIIVTGNVFKSVPNLTAIVINNTYPGNLFIIAHLDEFVTGNVTFYLNTSDRNITIVNDINETTKSANATIGGLDAGTYTILVKYNGDVNFIPINITVKGTIWKANSNLTAIAQNVTYPSDLTVTATISNLSTGNINFAIDGVATADAAIVNGSASSAFSGLNGGTYEIIVTYNGDKNFNRSSVTITGNVLKTNSTVSANVSSEIFYGEDVNIDVIVNENATGNVTIFVDDNENITVPLADASNIKISGLTIGDHTIKVKYNGDNNYNASESALYVVTVKKLIPELIIRVPTVNYPNKLIVYISGNDDISGNLTITSGSQVVITSFNNALANASLVGLTPGTYDITVRYNGNDYYSSKSIGVNGTVLEADSNLIAEAQDTTYPSNFVVIANVADGVTGNITFNINDVSPVEVEIINGSASATFSGLDAGIKNITVTYNGDGNYASKTINVTGNIWKADSNLEAESSDVDYPNDLRIIATVGSGVTGNVTFTIGTNSITSTIGGNAAIATFSGLNAGEYNIIVTYNGDKNFNASTVIVNANVWKADSNLIANVLDVTYPDDLVVTATVDSGVTGNVTFTIDNTTIISAINGTTATATFTGLDAGEYNIAVTYNGDKNFNESSVNIIGNVLKADPNLTALAQDAIYPDYVLVTATVASGVSGNVTFTIGNKSQTRTISNNTATVSFSGLDAGIYNVILSYNGDKNFNPSTFNVYTNVWKADSNLIANALDVTYPDDFVVTATVDSGVTGNVTFTIDNTTIISVINGNAATATFTGLDAGEYNIAVTYNGDKNFNESSVNIIGNVLKADPNLTAIVENTTYPGNLFIIANVNEDVTGNVTFYLNTSDRNITIVADINETSNSANATIGGLDAGTYTILVKYSGDTNFIPVNITVKGTVWKANSNLTAATQNVIYPEDINVVATLSNLTVGNLTFTIVGVGSVVSEIVNGSASATFSGLDAGNYTIDVVYIGDKNFNGSSVSVNANVWKANSDLTVNTSDVIYPEDINVVATVNNLSTGNVTFTIVGVGSVVSEIVNGSASATFSGLDAGNYTIDVVYIGDKNFNGSSVSVNANVWKANPNLTVYAPDVTYPDYLLITATVDDGVTGNITITVGTESQTRTISRNTVNVAFYNLNAGIYDVEVNYHGNNNFNESTVNTYAKIWKANSNLTVNAPDVTYPEDIVVTATVIDGATGNVTFTIGNNSITTSIYGTTAQASFSGLGAGVYDVEVTYHGNNNFNESTVNIYANVLKADPNLIAIVENTTYPGNLFIIAYVDEGVTGNVTFYLNSSDRNITIVNDINETTNTANATIGGLDAGNYTIYISYNGDNNFIAVNITVQGTVWKANSNLTAIVQNVVYPGDLFVTANLSNLSSGNITFTIDGINSVVAEIVNGSASAVFTGLNAGTYEIIVSYNGDKNFNTSTISINGIVWKAESNVSASAQNATYPEDIVVYANVPVLATGNITFSIDGIGSIIAEIVNGSAYAVFSGLNAGNYTINVGYNGDNNFNNSSVDIDITIFKANSTITAFVEDEIIYGDNVVIVPYLNFDATGNITVFIDGNENITVDLADASIIKIYGLNVGNHIIKLKYNGDINYNPSESEEYNLNVKKANPELIVNVSDIVYGDDLVIIASLERDATGNVFFTVDGKPSDEVGTKVVTINNGVAVAIFHGLFAGNYNITVEYLGDSNYYGVEPINSTATVDKAIPEFNVAVEEEFVFGEFSKIDVVLPLDATGNVTFIIDNNFEETISVEDLDGIGLKYLTAGNHTLAVIYNGDDNYYPSENLTFNITVKKADPDLLVIVDREIIYGEDADVFIVLPLFAEGYVTIILDGNVYANLSYDNLDNITISDLKAGNHTVIVKYSGDDNYIAAEYGEFIINVLKATPSLDVAHDIEITYGEDASVNITIPEDATGNVTITIDDEEYSTVNVSDLDNYVISGLNAGVHVIKVNTMVIIITILQNMLVF